MFIFKQFDITDNPNMKIKDELIDSISKSFGQMLREYSTEIEEASETTGKISISLPVKLEEDGPNIDVKLGIGFVKTKITDETHFVFSEQQDLFE